MNDKNEVCILKCCVVNLIFIKEIPPFSCYTVVGKHNDFWPCKLLEVLWKFLIYLLKPGSSILHANYSCSDSWKEKYGCSDGLTVEHMFPHICSWIDNEFIGAIHPCGPSPLLFECSELHTCRCLWKILFRLAWHTL